MIRRLFVLVVGNSSTKRANTSWPQDGALYRHAAGQGPFRWLFDCWAVARVVPVLSVYGFCGGAPAPWLAWLDGCGWLCPVTTANRCNWPSKTRWSSRPRWRVGGCVAALGGRGDVRAGMGIKGRFPCDCDCDCDASRQDVRTYSVGTLGLKMSRWRAPAVQSTSPCIIGTKWSANDCE